MVDAEALPDVIMCKSVLYRNDFNIFDILPRSIQLIMKLQFVMLAYQAGTQQAEHRIQHELRAILPAATSLCSRSI